MNVWIVQLVFISLIQLPVDIVHSAEEKCYRGDLYDYDNPCFGDPGQPEKLDLCPAGQKLAERCTERCDFCESGTFSDSFNNCYNCKPCLTECPEGQVIIVNCTSNKNAECGCPPCQEHVPSSCPPCICSPCSPCPEQTTEWPMSTITTAASDPLVEHTCNFASCQQYWIPLMVVIVLLVAAVIILGCCLRVSKTSAHYEGISKSSEKAGVHNIEMGNQWDASASTQGGKQTAIQKKEKENQLLKKQQKDIKMKDKEIIQLKKQLEELKKKSQTLSPQDVPNFSVSTTTNRQDSTQAAGSIQLGQAGISKDAPIAKPEDLEDGGKPSRKGSFKDAGRGGKETAEPSDDDTEHQEKSPLIPKDTSEDVKVTELQEDLDKKNERNEQLLQSLQGEKDESKNLKKRVKELEENKNKLQKVIQEKEACIQVIEGHLVEKDKKVAKLQEDLNKKDKEIQLVQTQFEESQKSEELNKVKELEENQNKLQKETQEKEARIQKIECQLKEKDKKVAKLQEDLNKKDKEIQLVQSQFEESQKSEELNKVKELEDKLQKDTQEKEARIQEIECQLVEKDKNEAKLREDLIKKDKELQLVQSQLQESQKEPKSFSSQTLPRVSSPQRKPDEDKMYDTFDYLKGHLSKDWQNVGRELGLKNETLDEIKSDNQGQISEVIYRVLCRWKQKNGSKATYLDLIKALNKADRTDLAEDIQNRKDLF